MGSNSRIDDITLEQWRKNIEEVNNDRRAYLGQYKKDKEEKIYEIIKLYSLKGNGISHNDLAKQVHMDRKSIRPYKKNLIEKKLIKINDVGNIVSTQEDYRDSIFNSEVMSLSFIDLLKESRPLILEEVKIDLNDLPNPYIINFAEYQELYKPNFSDKDKTEKDLFEFSNRIGSFMIFLLMYAMDPKNHNMSSSSEEQEEIITRMMRTGIKKIIPDIIVQFALLFNEKEIKENQLSSGRISVQETPKFVFTEEYRKKTYDAFTRLYALVTYELEKSSDIRYSFNEELKNKISKVKEYQERFQEEKIKYQKILEKRRLCKHKFKDAIKTDSGLIIRQCAVCNYIKYQNKKHLTK